MGFGRLGADLQVEELAFAACIGNSLDDEQAAGKPGIGNLRKLRQEPFQALDLRTTAVGPRSANTRVGDRKCP